MMYQKYLSIRHSKITMMGTTLLVGCLLLSACATTSEYKTSPMPNEVVSNPTLYKDTFGKWGGKIISVKNLNQGTEILLMSKKLDRKARPYRDGDDLGRMLIQFPGFKDPEVYAPGTMLTVTGHINGIVKRKVGDYEYPYLEVIPSNAKLWKKSDYPQTRSSYYDPWFDSFYFGSPYDRFWWYW